MPVRSLNSSVIKWPDLNQVHQALKSWVNEQVALHPQILRIGYFGSYARGDWGVGSDLDLIIIVNEDERPFSERALDYDTSHFPVPLEVLVYTVDEWRNLARSSVQFYEAIESECVWVYVSE
jgi:uncharacterized protein